MTERSSNFRPRREAPRETPENLIVGRNAVREALRAGRDMEKLLVSRGEATGSLREILALAREKGVVVQEVDRRRLDEMAENHQGVAALASMYAYSTLEEILALAREKGEPPFLVVLDGITDPHNLGAIVRTAECMGAHGVILPERRAVGLTPAAMKAAAGALEWIKVARARNPQGAERLDLRHGHGRRGLPPGELCRRVRAGHRRGGPGREPPCAGDVRPGRLHPHEGAHRLAQRLRGRGRDPGRDRAAKGLKPCCTLWTATT